MMRALYTAATGMIAEQTNVDTIANNLSNVNTTGFKAERTEFKSLLYQTLQTRTTTANGEQKPVGAQVGLGTRVAATMSMYTQGSLTNTEIDTDFAIEGDGFFAVRDIDGETYYTRSGAFTWSITADGRTILADSEGCPVLDREGNEIVVPEGVSSESMVFGKNGSISYKDQTTGNVISLNQFFGIYQFNNPAGLEKLSSTKLMATPASGNPMQEGTTPGLKLSKVHHKWLEASNVQVADEMVNMIIAQRAYELNSKAIQTADSMLDTANQLKR
ncbi:MAG: flagellar basal-body rod protein FlgG [Muribaculaceae bacterium]|nr:flagellar basal-body rod protein FlgG [Roseburia sp.]MCM1431547.1 flagellar basal-body rod protein FlgG [Muribaculaceae bacterium]MCM1492012.1 flagellar basal-body rod protein FlgG [Muribaculaceae bacterium]